jgi:hypothetical protein
MGPLCRTFAPALLLILGIVPHARAYSVLTHEALVDAAWEKSIAPLLRERYPSATAIQIRKARAYAYGGAMVQDLGYYPPASRLVRWHTRRLTISATP